MRNDTLFKIRRPDGRFKRGSYWYENGGDLFGSKTGAKASMSYYNSYGNDKVFEYDIVEIELTEIDSERIRVVK